MRDGVRDGVPEPAPGSPSLGWRVVTRVPAATAELAVDVLWQHDVQAVEERDDGSGFVRYVAGVLDRDVAAVLARALEEFGRVTIEEVLDDGWLDIWRDFAVPVAVGRMVVVPAWVPVPVDLPDDAVVVAVEPGRAFGSGAHETTRLALASLVAHLGAGDRVLDVGCGSGVLSVAAALLGAISVEALDIELLALNATRDNADRNGVASVVRARTGPVDASDAPVDLVLANILAPVLIELAPAILARLASGGRLILSGFLADQVDRVAAAYGEMVIVDHTVDGPWHSLVLGRSVG
jgi:ribosomal protein L11 methyltransferase